ncbi:MAG: dihydrofolate reductase [Betaproteobacteria bacterium]|jgi:dihydrofolate reductase|nr:dihydrofolate reductase [Betaproteobacteria bacterium]HMV20644.1 dihydrofolate reductase [Rhodocyclaceae bacterium]HNE44379.1 dihydrofolate reductase [Rhodocyclaceae bacterium]HNL21688.1 dihydrofolate reductase [Rhodocyclaceae bacterium]HNM23509.1 dihydrofolate reductase [Rhodocyclaceae bacterium]
MPQLLTVIAAVARNRVIGRGNDLVWRDPLDMQRFKALTAGGVVVMGRRTWESLPPRFRPLPGRRNVVITRQPDYPAPGAEVAHSLEDALARVKDAPEVFVIGGGELYAHALPRANRLCLTEVEISPAGDTLFPEIDPGRWQEVSREAHLAADGTRFAFVDFAAKTPVSP